MDDTKQLNQITGTVTAVIYQNEENGYTVIRLDIDDCGEVTAVGCMPGITPGESIDAEGRWMRHATYGEQFKVEALHRCVPVGVKAIFEYLSSKVIKGIGPKSAKLIVDEFGANALKVIEETPEKLTSIKGFTEKRAIAIHDAYLEKAGMRLLIDFLGENALPLTLAMPLYRRFGNSAPDVVRENPYFLIEGDIGLDFSAADELAIRMGMDGDDPQRMEAGLLFELRHNLNNGHTFLPREKFIQATAQLLSLNEECLERTLDNLIEQGEVVQEEIVKHTACYLAEIYAAEIYVAFRLQEMCETEFIPPKNINNLIEQIQTDQKIEYAPQQIEAVHLAASRQVILLTGGPGTGKTTTLRGVLAMFENLGLKTALAAPTGRAAKRLGELCNVEGTTIHRLLETQFDPVTGQLVFAHDQDDPLCYDAVIVDETSMVDISLMRALLCALRGDCRLVLVGDPDQLPSVGPGNVLSDLLRSERVPAVRLTEIFRQAAESSIVCTAHAVNRGEPPQIDNNKTKDFFFMRRHDSVRTAETIVELVSQRLPCNMGIRADQIQVLSPTRKYTTGTANLNHLLQQALNPPQEGKGERRFGDVVFRTGDRVMQIKNDYDVMWHEENRLSVGLGIFNGDIGRIIEVDEAEGTLCVDFDGKIVEYTPDMLSELELAYAITVHKSQGSEYKAVILAAHDGAPQLMTRGVLYTAVTRARDLFVLVGDENVVISMTANNRQQRRYSGLRARMRQ